MVFAARRGVRDTYLNLIKELKLMKKALLCCTLYAIIIYLTGGVLNLTLAATHHSGEVRHMFAVLLTINGTNGIRTNIPTVTMRAPLRRI